MGTSDRWVLFSEVHGTVLKDGKPVQGAELVAKAEWSDNDADNPTQHTVTDEKGQFSFPALERKRGFLHRFLPTQPMVHQTIVIKYQGVEYEAWMHGKADYEPNTELDGRPLNFVCELTSKPEATGTHYGICKPV
ncbi:carboxypeptidase regulatory-like domain-containing protein [Dyella choica]|uniref:Carboxypeptidase regulatory-like domain-containing protein n=2 Tax=Dyella choica TaxID=1927959 RepID=A0A432M9P4_9GAMM|nr:carboxypeptidase regulatory-like domain-containing protein [Dyella choica]